MRLMLLLLLPCFSFGQAQAPKDANTILVRGLSFMDICEAMLDRGYVIERKDSELKTASTGPILYPKFWNGAYKINVRVKDSVACFSGIYKCPYYLSGDLERNWDTESKIYYHTNKKGEVLPKSMIGYPFLLMNEFVKSLGKPVEYIKQ